MYVAQFAHTGIDGICDAVLPQQFLHHLPRRDDFLFSCPCPRPRAALIHRLSQVVERKMIAVDFQCAHEPCLPKAFMYFSGSGRRSNLSSTMMCMVSPVASSARSRSRNTS